MNKEQQKQWLFNRLHSNEVEDKALIAIHNAYCLDKGSNDRTIQNNDKDFFDSLGLTKEEILKAMFSTCYNVNDSYATVVRDVVISGNGDDLRNSQLEFSISADTLADWLLDNPKKFEKLKNEQPELFDGFPEVKDVEVFIIDPDTDKEVSISEWKKDKKPKRATYISIHFVKEGYGVRMIKCHSEEELPLDDFKPFLKELGEGWNHPTRRQCLDIYDAKPLGINEALALIGGDELDEGIWTCEENTQYYSYVLWVFCYSYGSLDGWNGKNGSFCARPLLAFNLDSLNN